MEEAGEVEMKDVADLEGKAGKSSNKEARGGKDDMDMEVDGVD